MLDLLPDLCDEYGDALQVAEPLFQDFGGKALFHGQAVTLSCYEDNSLVRELVNRPGQGQVMVIDGGGSCAAPCSAISWRSRRRSRAGKAS